MAPNHQTPALPPTDRLCLSVAEAADAIRVSPRQVYTLARDCGLPTIKLLGRRLVPLEAFRRWLAEFPLDRPGAERPDEPEPETARAAGDATARQEKDRTHGP